jgi:hypothetical protein
MVCVSAKKKRVVPVSFMKKTAPKKIRNIARLSVDVGANQNCFHRLNIKTVLSRQARETGLSQYAVARLYCVYKPHQP